MRSLWESKANSEELRGKFLTTFGTARIDDIAPTYGFHAGAEAVGALAANDGRLESTFHKILLSACRAILPRADRTTFCPENPRL
jgi:hypothetical protein